MKKTIALTPLTLLVVVSCMSSQQNTPMILPAQETPALTPVSSEMPSAKPSITLSPTTVSNDGGAFVPENALISYSTGLGIYWIAPNGEAPNLVIESEGAVFYESPSWSPNGDSIAFFSRGNGLSSKVSIINRDGGDLQLVQDNIEGHPSWSPDGKHIAFATNLGLYISNANGQNMRKISELAFRFPAWSPDGKKLALLGDSIGYYGPYKIYLINSDGTDSLAVTEMTAGVSHISWSPDGGKIAFRSFDGCGDIEVLDLETGEITNLTNTPNVVEQDPAWSPDGGYIAFSKAFYTPCEQNQVYAYQGDDIYIMKINGHDVTQLTFGTGGFEPSWWPLVILKRDWRYAVTNSGSNLNVRESPTIAAKSLILLQQGEIFSVFDGPQEADGYSWWHIRTNDGIEGWIVDVPGWYVFERAP